MRRHFRRIAACTLLLLCATTAGGQARKAGAIPTKVVVRAVSRDAKIIGDHVGGARITIRDARTREVLAWGIQKGNTGQTELIMNRPRTRGASLYSTEGAAQFEATLMLVRPVVAEITAEGPLGSPQATQTARKTMLLVPGQDITGDGVILEIHGFIVKILAPAALAHLKAGEQFEVRATVNMA